MLEKADAQARDTTRKHHLDDVELALYFARRVHGTYPPYETAQWCGKLANPDESSAVAEIEAALREQNEKYANPEKPFPTDPLSSEDRDYVYVKQGPASFLLLANLELDGKDLDMQSKCDDQLNMNYMLDSLIREGRHKKYI